MNKIRNLIYIPIIHARADMGTNLGAFQQEVVEGFGKNKEKTNAHEIKEMWIGLKNRICELQLEWKKIRIYQDGLPFCGQEIKMVNNLANKGSENHKLLAWLVKRGAILEGSEDMKLLLNEYIYVQEIMYAATDKDKKKSITEYEKVADQFMLERDNFIRHRIDKTLQVGETALLFMGIMHKIEEGLADDIHITYLVHRLPFKEQFVIKGKCF